MDLVVGDLEREKDEEKELLVTKQVPFLSFSRCQSLLPPLPPSPSCLVAGAL